VYVPSPASHSFILDLVRRPPDVPLDSWPRVLVLFELVFRPTNRFLPLSLPFCSLYRYIPVAVPLVVLMLVMRESVSNTPDLERVLARGVRPRGPLPVGGINGQRSLRSRTVQYSAWIFDVRLRIGIGSTASARFLGVHLHVQPLDHCTGGLHPRNSGPAASL
jgi:hypothetical protein